MSSYGLSAMLLIEYERIQLRPSDQVRFAIISSHGLSTMLSINFA